MHIHQDFSFQHQSWQVQSFSGVWTKETTRTSEDGSPPKLQACAFFYASLTLQLQVAVWHGKVHDQWKTIINFMLEKLAGNPMDWQDTHNSNLQGRLQSAYGPYLWLFLTNHAIQHNALNKNQWAQPGKSMQQPVMLKHLCYTMLHLTCTCGSSFDNDAKACFDQIIMPLAMICCRQLRLRLYS